MTKSLIKALVAEVRAHNVSGTYSAEHGWHAPFEHSCALCKSKWLPGKPEKHKVRCLIARADKATGAKPRIVPLRPLR